MFGLSRKIAGIDIGFESIKIVGVKQSGQNNHVFGFNNVPLNRSIIESDHIADKNQIAELIKKGLSEAKPESVKVKGIVTVMPEYLVFSKTLQLPKMEEADLKNAALSHAQQYIPVSLNDVNIDSQTLIIHPDEPLVDVLVVATPKALVKEYQEIFKLVGVEILAIETKALAIARSIIAPTDTGGIILLEIGTTTSRVSLIDNLKTRFVSTTNIGSDQIIKPLISSTASADDLETAKYKTGLSDDLGPAATPIAKIIEDLTQAIRYHQNRDYKASRIVEIRICGRGAMIPGIAAAIEKQIKIKTVIGNFNLKNVPAGLDQRYAVALGLAMYKGDGSD